ncbi:MAG: aminopeptidase P family protein, partial [Gammaproteobacteria bacterium]|nr:aminopeptidase P family protein [Gammaproteobacteria bacterium]
MNIVERLNKLRELMKDEGMDAYLIDNADHHSSEYVNNHYKERSYMTSFDGSNGKALVTLTSAYLWTDGRYFLQAEKDFKDLPITLMKMGVEGYPTIKEFLNQKLNGKVLGLDGECFSYNEVKELEEVVIVKSDKDLVDKVWNDRPEISFSPIWFLNEKLSGEPTKSKLERVRREMDKLGATAHVLTNIDDVAYLYNLRGGDVDITPVFLSFAYVDLNKAYVFLNKDSLNEESIKELKRAKVVVKDYNEFTKFLSSIHNESVLLDSSKMNYSYVDILEKNGNKLVNKENPTVLMKAVKNEVQNKNNRYVHILDGLAVFRFMKNLKEMYRRGEHIDEYQQAEYALKFRSMSDKFYEVSFDSISSWNENGAVIHYEPTKESSKTVEGTGFFLLDSGGQYMGGTTDITRTFQLGDISDEMKHHYTMVLKGFIDVSNAHFIKGTTGQNLDMLARAPFWQEGLDYRHGTGHGVGYMLNVHEGPQRTAYQNQRVFNPSSAFRPGMVTSIEPGLYLANKYGIRIEDEILCVKDKETEWGEFYKFETL